MFRKNRHEILLNKMFQLRERKYHFHFTPGDLHLSKYNKEGFTQLVKVFDYIPDEISALELAIDLALELERENG